MLKLRIGVVLLGLLLAVLAPVAAQDQTIVDIAVGASQGEAPEFTVLVEAVLAADLAGALSGEGPFTVFAPTDAAFVALLGELGVSKEDLLANKELLTSVLTYHVVAGRVLAADVVGLDGQEVTTLNGAPISIAARNGGVVLNGDVNVVATDIEGSNGVIHVIDKVLLPPMEAAAPEMPADMAHIRVAHFSPDAPAVDVYINGELSPVQGFEFANMTDWIEVPAGTYNIAVAPAGTSIDSAVIGPADLTFGADSWTTIAAVGSVAAGTLKPALVAEPVYNNGLDGKASVTVFHAIPDAPAVDVRVNGGVAVQLLGFPGTLGNNDGAFDLSVGAGSYDIQVVPSGATAPVVLNLPGTQLAPDTYYFVAAVGTLANPQVVVKTTTKPAAEASLPSIADVVVSAASGDQPEFTTLLAAVQAAGLTDTLAGEGTFTVFAPTDAAFAAAFAALGIEPAALLADTDTLTSILTYHVLGSVAMAADVVGLDGQEVTTLNGAPIRISIVDGKVLLNDTIQVIVTDIEASNGVIHVIDGVLLPPA
jgi:uncharacterized surface protein with fasciclin (FAS1) repeats